MRAPKWKAFSRGRWELIPRERWHEFPVHPRPKEGESLSSWFCRLAHSNGLSEIELTRVLFGQTVTPRLDWDIMDEPDVLKCLEVCGSVIDLHPNSVGHLVTSGLQGRVSGPLGAWVIDIRYAGFSRISQVCLECVAASGALRLEWRFAFNSVCVRHRLPLTNPCEACAPKADEVDCAPAVLVLRAAECESCSDTRSQVLGDHELDRLINLQELLASMVREQGATYESFLAGLKVLVDVVIGFRACLGDEVKHVFSRFPNVGATSGYGMMDFERQSGFDRRAVLCWLSTILFEEQDEFTKVLYCIAEHKCGFNPFSQGDMLLEALFDEKALRRDRCRRDFSLHSLYDALRAFIRLAQRVYAPASEKPALSRRTVEMFDVLMRSK